MLNKESTISIKAVNCPSLSERVVKLTNHANLDSPKKHQEEFLFEENLPILEGYQYELSYIASKGPRKRKRTIHCKYPGCNKQYIKTWNFLDHARMHLGIKPFT